MRTLFFVSCIIMAQCMNAPAMAVEYPWCRSGPDGGTNCGFTSFQQCGGGPYCFPESPLHRAEFNNIATAETSAALINQSS